MLRLLRLLSIFATRISRSRRDLFLENLALRQQLALLKQNVLGVSLFFEPLSKESKITDEKSVPASGEAFALQGRDCVLGSVSGPLPVQNHYHNVCRVLE